MKSKVQIDHSKLRRLATTLVVLLMVVFATAREVHNHSSANDLNPNESHCSLCMAVHSAAAPAQATTALVVFTSYLFEVAAETQPHSRLSIPSTFIRPPPASL